MYYRGRGAALYFPSLSPMTNWLVGNGTPGSLEQVKKYEMVIRKYVEKAVKDFLLLKIFSN